MSREHFLCVKQWNTMNSSGNVEWIDVGIEMPSFSRGLYNMVRAALWLSDSNCDRIKRKIAKNNLVINLNFCYPYTEQGGNMKKGILFALLLGISSSVYADIIQIQILCPTPEQNTGLWILVTTIRQG